MSKGAFQTRLGQMGEIPNFQQTPPMAHTGNYFVPPRPDYLPRQQEVMAMQKPMSIQQPIANIMASGGFQQQQPMPMPMPRQQQPMPMPMPNQAKLQTLLAPPSLLTQPEIPGAPIQTPPQSLLQPQDYFMGRQEEYGRPLSRGSLPSINLFR